MFIEIMRKQKMSEDERYDLYIKKMYKPENNLKWHLLLWSLVLCCIVFVYTHPQEQPLTEQELNQIKSSSFQIQNAHYIKHSKSKRK